MGLFKRSKVVQAIPDDVRGCSIAIDDSTGEKLIGFKKPDSRKLQYTELVTSEKDIKAYYEKYGVPYTKG